MAGLGEDKRIVLPLMGGGKVAIPIVTPGIGDPCIVIPLQGGGKAVTKLTTPMAGDPVVVMPLQGGGKVAVPLTPYSYQKVILLMPVGINYGVTGIIQNSWHNFGEFTFHLPWLSSISKISLVNGYTVTGDLTVQDPDSNGYILITDDTGDPVNNYVTMSVIGWDDILWIYNNGNSSGREFYAGNGYQSGIWMATLSASPDVTDMFDLTSSGDRTVSLTIQCSDYWGSQIAGTLGYIAIEFLHSGDSFVKYSDNQYGYYNSKYYGFDGFEIGDTPEPI